MRKLNVNNHLATLACAVGLATGSSAVQAAITSLGADGWASVGANNLGQTGTTGGNGATAVKTYTVTNRNQFIQALYGNAATIKPDGSFSGTLDNGKKVIYISGTISLNMNQALHELTGDDYIVASNASSSTCASYGFTSYASWWSAYQNAYKPPYATVPSGTPEQARSCAGNLQRKVTRISIPSNTSIIGVGTNAKIIHGSLWIGSSSSTPVDNIVVRNIAFEDAFDFFPQWDPTDSGGRWNSAYDNISVSYATHVWIDHCTFSDGARTDNLYPSVWAGPYNTATYEVEHHDGLLDITGNANYVTVSHNHFHDHNKTTLIGSSDTATLTDANPAVLKTTVHHNFYQNLVQRQPRMLYGMVHLYNNFYTGVIGGSGYGWSYGWYAGQGSKIYAENNVFNITGNSVPVAGKLITATSSASKVTSCAALAGMSTQYCSAYIYDTGTVLNGESVNASTAANGINSLINPTATPWPSKATPTATPSATPSSYYSYTVESTANLSTSVPANAGAGKL